MSDLIERLRERNRKCLKCGDETCNFCRERTEAADEIERLRELVKDAFMEGFGYGATNQQRLAVDLNLFDSEGNYLTDTIDDETAWGAAETRSRR